MEKFKVLQISCSLHEHMNYPLFCVSFVFFRCLSTCMMFQIKQELLGRKATRISCQFSILANYSVTRNENCQRILCIGGSDSSANNRVNDFYCLTEIWSGKGNWFLPRNVPLISRLTLLAHFL